MKARYDFTGAADFLDNSVPLQNLYEDVLRAMKLISKPSRTDSEKDRCAIWGTLLECADFIETIGCK